MESAKSRMPTVALSALGCAMSVVSATTALAQITEVARTPVESAAQLTFGYLCDDRFVIRNDDTKPVDLEYGLEKGNAHTKLTLNARESVELASKSNASVELWMDGKLIAKAKRERRSCKDVQGNSAVTVTPLEVAGSDDSRSRYPIGYGFGYGFGYRSAFYDPWGFGYYGLGSRPVYSNVVVISRRGGGRRR